MTIEIKPETGQLVHEEIESGHFHSIDELIFEGIHAWREKHPAEQATPKPRMPKKNFVDFLLEAPLSGSGMKLERQKDSPQPINL